MTNSVSLEGYLNFLRTYVAIPVAALPDNSPYITQSLCVAQNVVSPQLEFVDGCNSPSYCTGNTIYDLAVYNLATDYLINWAQDQPGSTYFANARKSFGINNFVAGVISESHDESTGQTILSPDFFKNITLSDLQRLKTPYGQQYLQFAQDLGTLWGLS